MSKSFLDSERKALPAEWYRQDYLASVEDSAYALVPYSIIQCVIDPSLKMLNIDLDDDEEERSG